MLSQFIAKEIKRVLRNSTGSLCLVSFSSHACAFPSSKFTWYTFAVINHSYEYGYMLCTVSLQSKSLSWEWGMIGETRDKDGNSNQKKKHRQQEMVNG